MKSLLLHTFLFLTFITAAMTPSSAQTPAFCDPETGLCTLRPMEETKVQEVEWREGTEIIYVGDPMCSWCWGISPQLNELKRLAESEGIPYRIVVGGLRPGGGDPWNQQFREFLQHHWEEVGQRSGQPFGESLFELEHFDYDTEPSCRAVVVARQMNPDIETEFFELTQHYFYVQNKDPKLASFYQPICEQLNLEFCDFEVAFNSPEAKAKTQAEFQLNRQWGVRGYPTVLLRQDDQLFQLANGYATYQQMWSQVSSQLAIK